MTLFDVISFSFLLFFFFHFYSLFVLFGSSMVLILKKISAKKVLLNGSVYYWINNIYQSVWIFFLQIDAKRLIFFLTIFQHMWSCQLIRLHCCIYLIPHNPDSFDLWELLELISWSYLRVSCKKMNILLPEIGEINLTGSFSSFVSW